MKIRKNSCDPCLLYIEPEDEKEKEVLDEMWREGIEVFAFGSGSNDELGICSKKFFGSKPNL